MSCALEAPGIAHFVKENKAQPQAHLYPTFLHILFCSLTDSTYLTQWVNAIQNALQYAIHYDI